MGLLPLLNAVLAEHRANPSLNTLDERADFNNRIEHTLLNRDRAALHGIDGPVDVGSNFITLALKDFIHLTVKKN